MSSAVMPLIMVVDDESGVRDYAAAVLRRAGYTVLTAESASEGLALAKTWSGRLASVLTDVVMPAMDGITLAAEIRQAHPHVKVVLMSGYAALDREEASGFLFLAKPFNSRKLLETVRAALNGSLGDS